MILIKKYFSSLFLFSALGLFFYALALLLNSLATLLPINGLSTGQISDLYPSLFTPSGSTFSIWGIIYSFLTIFSFYCIYLSSKTTSPKDKKFLQKLQVLFIATSIFNGLWILAWHYLVIFMSVVIMILLLLSLILINLHLRSSESKLRKDFFIKTPFELYFGWITVATIANITALLVAKSWNGWGLSENFWTIFILFVGATIGLMTAYYFRSITYLFVLIWAYFGILTRHISSFEFNYQYPGIIFTLYFSITLFASLAIYLFLNKKNLRAKNRD